MYLHNILSLPFLLTLRKSICYPSIITHTSGFPLEKECSIQSSTVWVLAPKTMNNQREREWDGGGGVFLQENATWLDANTHAHTATAQQNENAGFLWNLHDVCVLMLAHCPGLTSARFKGGLTSRCIQIQKPGKNQRGNGWECRETDKTSSRSTGCGYLPVRVSRLDCAHF